LPAYAIKRQPNTLLIVAEDLSVRVGAYGDSATGNASISYGINTTPNWLIYTSPVNLKSGDTLHVQVVRYGYKESNVESYIND